MCHALLLVLLLQAAAPRGGSQARLEPSAASRGTVKGGSDSEPDSGVQPRGAERPISAVQAAGRKLIEEDEASGQPGAGTGTGTGTGTATGQHTKVHMGPGDGEPGPEPWRSGTGQGSNKHGFAHRLRRRATRLLTHLYIAPNSKWCVSGSGGRCGRERLRGAPSQGCDPRRPDLGGRRAQRSPCAARKRLRVALPQVHALVLLHGAVRRGGRVDAAIPLRLCAARLPAEVGFSGEVAQRAGQLRIPVARMCPSSCAWAAAPWVLC